MPTLDDVTGESDAYGVPGRHRDPRVRLGGQRSRLRAICERSDGVPTCGQAHTKVPLSIGAKTTNERSACRSRSVHDKGGVPKRVEV